MKNMKKLAGLILAIVMAFAMTAVVFAAESNLSINTKNGHTYKVYQMLIGDVSGFTAGENGTNSGTIANVAAGENLITTKTVSEFQKAAMSKSGSELGDEVYKCIANDPYKTIVGDGQVKTESVDNGYYLIVDTWTGDAINTEQLSRFVVTVVGDTTVTPKDSTTDIDKKIIDTDANKAIDDSKKTDTASIGDTIEYEVTGTVPNSAGYKYYYYILQDTLSNGLTLNQDSFVVTIGGTEIIKGDGDNQYKMESTEHSFELRMNDIMKFTTGAAISVKYTATVNDNAQIGTDPNTNTVLLKYSNNPENSQGGKTDEPGDVLGETPERTTKTYVTKLTIQKTDSSEKAFIDALKGATFKLTGTGLNDVVVTTETVFVEAADGTYYKLKDGTYTETVPTETTKDKYESTTKKYKTVTKTSLTDGESGSELNITAVVDADGKITFTGLNVGEYKIEETNVPVGYNKCDDIEFKIVATQTGSSAVAGGTIAWSATNTDGTASNVKVSEVNGVFSTTIENVKGNTLPSTGGIGTTIFYVVGAILLVFAAVLLITKKRMKSE